VHEETTTIVSRALFGHGLIEMGCEELFNGQWPVLGNVILDWLVRYNAILNSVTLVAVVPEGVFYQLGYALRRDFSWVDIADTLVMGIDPRTRTYLPVGTRHRS